MMTYILKVRHSMGTLFIYSFLKNLKFGKTNKLSGNIRSKFMKRKRISIHSKEIPRPKLQT